MDLHPATCLPPIRPIENTDNLSWLSCESHPDLMVLSQS